MKGYYSEEDKDRHDHQFRYLLDRTDNVLMWCPFGHIWRIMDYQGEREVWCEITELSPCRKYLVNYAGVKEDSRPTFEEAVRLALEWINSISLEDYKLMLFQAQENEREYMEAMEAYYEPIRLDQQRIVRDDEIDIPF